ncbi:MAG: hypothetical protein IRY97_04535, partial [Thermomicrobiaceae bacterium]|nr:hypothetical protein [Thermomicrobiaceae bacterium]
VSYLAFDRSTADLAPWQILIAAGLTGAALAALSLAHRRAIARSAALIACAGLATLGTVMVWREAPRDDPEIRFVGLGNAVATSPSDQPPPVCTGSPVSVCAHPKWQPLLDDAVAVVNRLAEPLLGLPGVPPRAEPDDVLFMEGGAFSLLNVGEGAVYDVSGFADKLVADPAAMRDGVVVNEAQFAIRSWLLARADLASHWRCDAPMFTYPYVPGASPESTCAAAERFGRLSEGEQRAWLEARYADLRAGRLTLADLP